jgi:beta-glucanase (GH16 family)
VFGFVPIARAQDPVWADEFDGTTLNPANWEPMIGTGTSYGLPAGWGNNEWQYYTARSENLFVSGGYLHIVARQESYAGSDYTSARIRTRNRQEFLYGRIEARIKLPSTRGIWPAFWMLPTDSPYGGWAASGEIDIMESINTATTIHGTLHFGGNWPNNASHGGSVTGGINYGDDFHVYRIDWEPDSFRWYVDNQLYFTATSNVWYSTAAPENPRAPFDTPFHLLLNVAVGGNWPGYPNSTSVFPQEMLVDWVRVYAFDTTQAPFAGAPYVVPGVIEAEDFDLGPDGVAYHDCDANNQGGAYRPSAGVDIEPCAEGGFNIGWMCSGEWTEYTIEASTNGAYQVLARVSAPSAGGAFRLLVDGTYQTGSLAVPTTGGWQNWTNVAATIELTAGEHILRFANNSSAEYNVNSFTFNKLPAADIDRSGAVNLADFALLGACTAGPGASSPPVGCTATNFARSDLDGDGDVDLADYRYFQRMLD